MNYTEWREMPTAYKVVWKVLKHHYPKSNRHEVNKVMNDVMTALTRYYYYKKISKGLK